MPTRWFILLILGSLALAMGCGPAATPKGIPVAEYPGEGSSSPYVTKLGLTLTGTFWFEKLQMVTTDGSSWSMEMTTMPLRQCDILALDGVTNVPIQLLPSVTNDLGQFTLKIPLGKTFSIGISTSTTNTSGRVNAEIRDPTSSIIGAFPLYVIPIVDGSTGKPFSPAAGVTKLTMLPFTLSSAQQANGLRYAALANIMDAALNASDAIRLVNGGTSLSRVTFLWSPNSTTGTYYSPQGYLNGPAITVRGGDSSTQNTDEWDDFVLAHEYGHHASNLLWRDNSLGGVHAIGDALYPSLAWGEGVATFFSGIVKNSPWYWDSQGITGSNPQVGFLYLEDEYSAVSRGLRYEHTSFEVPWDFVDGTNGPANVDQETYSIAFQTIHNALVGLRSNKTSYPWVTILDFLKSLVSTGAFSNSDVQTLLNGTGAFPSSVPPRNQQIDWTSSGSTLVYPPSVTVTSDAVYTGISDDASGLDECKAFYQFTLNATQNVSVTMQITGGEGTISDSSNLGLHILTIDTTDALVDSDTQEKNEVKTHKAMGALGQGTYVIYVDGCTTNRNSQYNATRKLVTYNLTVTQS